MNRYSTKFVLAFCFLASTLEVGALVGDTGSYVTRVDPDGVREIKAWIEVADSGGHFLTVLVDSMDHVTMSCTDAYPIPEGALNSTNGATDAVTTWTIELLKRKGHGRASTGFWVSTEGDQLAQEITAGKVPEPCR